MSYRVNTSDIGDIVREAIVATFEMFAEVLTNVPDSVTAKEMGERLSDPDVMSDLQGKLVAGMDQFIAAYDKGEA